MSEPDSPELPEAPPPPSEPLGEPAPERVPFWSYSDLFIFLGLAVAGQIAGALLVQLPLLLFHVSVRNELYKLLPAQFLGYLFLFLCVRMMFRVEYGKPFWKSLGWQDARLGSG